MNTTESVTIRVGERHTFDLPGLAGSGYLWSYEIQKDAWHVSCSHRSGPMPQAIGASPLEFVDIFGIESGSAVVRLVQKRPWETEPLHTRVVEINIE